jgi:hypothetical protein
LAIAAAATFRDADDTRPRAASHFREQRCKSVFLTVNRANEGKAGCSTSAMDLSWTITSWRSHLPPEIVFAPGSMAELSQKVPRRMHSSGSSRN